MITRIASTPIPTPVRSANKAIAAAETLRACGKSQAAKGTSGDLRSAVVSFEQAGNEFRNAGSLFRAVSADAQCKQAYADAAACYREAAKAASKTTMTHPVAYLLGLACQADERASAPSKVSPSMSVSDTADELCVAANKLFQNGHAMLAGALDKARRAQAFANSDSQGLGGLADEQLARELSAMSKKERSLAAVKLEGAAISFESAGNVYAREGHTSKATMAYTAAAQCYREAAEASSGTSGGTPTVMLVAKARVAEYRALK